MAKKFNFDNELNKILIDVFIAGKSQKPIDPALDIARNQIMTLLDRQEISRLQQVAVQTGAKARSR